MTFYRAVGCDECLNLGFKGRLAVFEIMRLGDDIARLVVQHADATVIRKQALANGMTLLSSDGVRQIKAGVTTIEEVLSVAHVEDALA